MRYTCLVIGRDVDAQFAAYDDEFEFAPTQGMCWECEGLALARLECPECAGTGLGTANARGKWDWYRIEEEGPLVNIVAEVTRRYGDDASPRVHTWALVVDGDWRDRYDEVPYEPSDTCMDRLDASLPSWIDRWEQAVADHPPDTPATFVIYHH